MCKECDVLYVKRMNHSQGLDWIDLLQFLLLIKTVHEIFLLCVVTILNMLNYLRSKYILEEPSYSLLPLCLQEVRFRSCSPSYSLLTLCLQEARFRSCGAFLLTTLFEPARSEMQVPEEPSDSLFHLCLQEARSRSWTTYCLCACRKSGVGPGGPSDSLFPLCMQEARSRSWTTYCLCTCRKSGEGDLEGLLTPYFICACRKSGEGRGGPSYSLLTWCLQEVRRRSWVDHSSYYSMPEPFI